MKRKPRYINEDLCVGCLECIDGLRLQGGHVSRTSSTGPEQAQAGLHPLPAGHPAGRPHRSRDLHPVQDRASASRPASRPATGRPSTSRRQEEFEEIEVGTIILATGFQTFDPSRLPVLRLRELPERLHRAGGRAARQRLRADRRRGRPARRPQAQGGRDHPLRRLARREDQPLVLPRLLHVLPEAGPPAQGAHRTPRSTTSTSTCGPRARATRSSTTSCSKEGVHFIRGRVAEVTDWADDARRGRQAGHPRRRHPDRRRSAASRWTWSSSPSGWSRSADAQDVRRMFNISCSTEGFFLERHPKLAPVNTFTDGIFIAGACQGPKDIPDTVAQAGRGGRRGPGPDRRGPRGAGAEHRLHRRGGLLRVQVLHPALPLHGHLLLTRTRRRPSSTRPSARDAAPAWRPVRPAPSRRTSSRTRRSSARSKGCCSRAGRRSSVREVNRVQPTDRPSNRTAARSGSRGSSPSSATGAPTPRPTWRASRA